MDQYENNMQSQEPGKTTTTSMISSIALEAGLDPTIMSEDFGYNRWKYPGWESQYFIAEACEYKTAFCTLAFYCNYPEH